ncbi:uncharacterized protein LOC121378007 [Gigantopelta aegis]|uniref:uncharacterized protein LOC121378007 n=1 Tax=Gigantopelta aegis TaxID=1735272 RepID=UPI001B8887E4|nr:uncharacterized protein LOC121378007 [Gigantopelta aegis]
MSVDLPARTDILFLILVSLVGCNEAALSVGLTPLTTNLNEKASTVALLPLTCINTSNTFAITKKSQNPFYCDKCFQVLKDKDPSKPGYWLWFHSGVAPLDYTSINLYTIDIECDDGTEKATASITVNIVPNQQPKIAQSTVTCTNKILAASVKAGDNVFLRGLELAVPAVYTRTPYVVATLELALPAVHV